MGTIINLAQDFVGSNNINLLQPIGQFGTRLAGGKDSASPRYIFTKLPQLTRLIFHPDDDALLDYLHKWYRHGWSFGELTRRLPSVVVPDDHDVYHGNVWGNAGVREPDPGDLTIQDRGGYKMPPAFVNAVHRTQVEHLPAPRGEPAVQ